MYSKCVECGRTRGNSHTGRGLCWKCYRNPGIVIRHKPTYTNQHDEKFITPAATATDAEPGSDAKTRVFAERVAARQELHHVEDFGYRGAARLAEFVAQVLKDSEAA